jgi:glycosyltransferase involved in cell wall biosynthesis
MQALDSAEASDRDLPSMSIVIPSFNQGGFIERTIESIISQGYPNLELILMDGGSTDQTMSIVDRYRKYFCHIESGPDGGQSAALCKGFGLAKGKYISWLNSDDTYCEGALLSVGRYLAKQPKIEFVYGNMNIIDAQDELIAFRRTPKFVLGVMKYAFLTVAQHSAFWTKDLYDRVGGIDRDLKFCMDFDLFVRMASVYAPQHVDITIGNFRIHGESKTSNFEEIRKREDRTVHDRYCSVKPDQSIRFALVRYYYLLILCGLTIMNGTFLTRVASRFKNRMRSFAS